MIIKKLYLLIKVGLLIRNLNNLFTTITVTAKKYDKLDRVFHDLTGQWFSTWKEENRDYFNKYKDI